MSTSLSEKPAVISEQQLLEQLNWRYATKKFDSTKKISSATWKTLEEALILSPSSYGLQPWKFIVVTNQEVKEKLVGASWNQKQLADASHVVVFTANLNVDENFVNHFIQRTVEVRGGSAEALEGYRKMMVGSMTQMKQAGIIEQWASKQLYIALGNLMTSAAVLGIDVCPMEGIVPAKYDEILGLTGKGFKTVVVATVGYRASDDAYSSALKVRFKKEEVVSHI